MNSNGTGLGIPLLKHENGFAVHFTTIEGLLPCPFIEGPRKQQREERQWIGCTRCRRQSCHHHRRCFRHRREQLAYQYATRRACLVLADIRGEILHKVADTRHERGAPDAVTVTADGSDVNDCKRIVDSAISHFRRLEHLVSNVGIISIEMVEDYKDITEAQSVMDINFLGSLYITHFAIPHLRNAGGKIIAMASSASWSPVPKLSIYSISSSLDLIVSRLIHLLRALVSVFPMGKADTCAKAIVKSTCRGERYLTEPAWYKVTYWLKMFAPELIEMFLRPLYLPKRAGSCVTSLSNMIVNLPGLKAILHPS